jgi:EmrB/QacA subfamily drug resistance transporter
MVPRLVATPADTRPPVAHQPRPGWRRLLAEPMRPARIRESPHAPRLALAAVCIGAFMGQLDASIVTLALPTLHQRLHAGIGAVEWVSLAYLLTLVGAISAIGRLSDILGRKLIYLYGFGVFTAASLACGLAPSLTWLIVFRVGQALGAAMLQANSVALIASTAGRDRLGRAIGVQGAAQALGLSLGPAAGGALIALAGWRWVFYVNVPFGLVGILLGWLLLPRTRTRAAPAPFDVIGLTLLLPAVSALLLALSRMGGAGAGSPAVLGGLGIAALLGAAFVRWEARRAAPLIDLSLFRQPGLAAALGSGLLSYLVLFGVMFVVPLQLVGTGESTLRAGLVLTILPLGLGLAAPAGGLLADRVGARLPTAAGMALAAAALLTAAFAPGPAPLSAGILLAGTLAAIGVGTGLFTPANNARIMSYGRTDQAGMVSGLLNMTRGIGTALGVALTGAAYSLGSDAALVMLAAVAALSATISVTRPAEQHA